MLNRIMFWSIAIIVFLSLALSLPEPIAGQQPITSKEPKNRLFAPFVFLQYGPTPRNSISVSLRSEQFTDTSNHTITFFNPSTSMDNISEADNLYHNDTIAHVFDSYFLFNRLLPQPTPRISNISINIAKVLNPF